MQFATLKQTARTEFRNHLIFYLLLFLIVTIVDNINTIIVGNSIDWFFDLLQDGFKNIQINYWYLILLVGGQAIETLLSFSASFHILDNLRHQDNYHDSLSKSVSIFSSRMIFGIIVVLILQFTFTVLWSLLFVIPGIVKSYSYSQAVFIYQDAIKSRNPISPLSAIKQSQRIMDGQKMDLFFLSLSFIGWGLLVSIFPITGLFINPYFTITMVNFYEYVSN